jgi:hypothetical protein
MSAAAVKSMQGACPGRSHFLKLTHASVPSGLNDEGCPDKSYDQYQKPGRNEGEEKLGHACQTPEVVLCAYGAAGGFCDVPEFNSRERTCCGAALAYSLVCSQSPLFGSSASRISLDGAAVPAGALSPVGVLSCRGGPGHQATPQGAAGAGEALALLYRQAESPCASE